jgi:hypothetical protein
VEVPYIIFSWASSENRVAMLFAFEIYDRIFSPKVSFGPCLLDVFVCEIIEKIWVPIDNNNSIYYVEGIQNRL